MFLPLSRGGPQSDGLGLLSNCVPSRRIELIGQRNLRVQRPFHDVSALRKSIDSIVTHLHWVAGRALATTRYYE